MGFLEWFSIQLVAWGVKKAADAGYDQQLKFWRRARKTKEVRAALDAALKKVFDKYVFLDRPDAFLELEPILRVEMERVLTPGAEPNLEKIGQILCAGCPTSSPPHPVIVGDFLVERFIQEVLSIEGMQQKLVLLQQYQTNQSVRRIERKVDQVLLEMPTIQAPSALSVAERARITATAEQSAPGLLEWPQILPTGEWISRPEEKIVVDRIETENFSCTILLGVPGAGKSALLARVGKHFKVKDGYTVIAIKADQLPVSVRDDKTLGKSLGLEASAARTILRLAVDQKVVVLVDQLDSVADLVDLKTERLNALIDLVHALANHPNVHVVCSSRIFEFHHDLRLSQLEGSEVILGLPKWEEISEILTKHGVDTALWPHDRCEAIRAPQFLKIFLSLKQALGTQAIRSTYVGMLDQLWDAYLPEVAHRNLVMQIAHDMADDEQLFEPVARYDGSSQLIADAVKVGVLRTELDGTRVGFAHQTFFDHALARGFIRDRTSLSEYVIQHQDSLYPRPRVWSLLTYLREADPNTYQNEVQAIWKNAVLRTHLRYLLIDFLGSRSDPFPWELLIGRECLQHDDTVIRMANASGDNEVWFKEFATGPLLDLMRSGDQRRRSIASNLLQRALPFAREKVLALVEAHWNTDAAIGNLFWVLEKMSEWDDRAIRLIQPFVEANEIADNYVCELATIVGRSRPEDAAHFVNKRLIWRVDQLKADKEALDNYIRNQNDWYQLPAVAEAAPKEFLSECYKWFFPAVDVISWGEPTPTAFRHCYVYGDFEDGTDSGRQSVFGSVYEALKGSAQSDADAFWALTERWRSQEIDLIQRMLARAFRVIAKTHPHHAVEFLLADRRRFELGESGGRHAETRALISEICQSGNMAIVLRLFTAVEAWQLAPEKIKGDTAPDRARYKKWHRAARLQLLTAFARDLLTDQQRKFVDEELRAFPEHEDELGGDGITGGFIKSRVSLSQMDAAKDADIIKVILETPDSCEDLDFRRQIGGSRQLGQEFHGLAKANPRRAQKIALQLPVENYTVYAEYAIQGIGEANIPIDEIIAHARSQIARGHKGRNYITAFAEALPKNIKKPAGLPQDIIDLFLSHLRDTDGERIVQEGNRKKDTTRSIIWDQGGAIMVPHGNYPLLRAIWWGYLLRDPSDGNAALDVLIEHLARKEDKDVWSHLAAFDLQYLHLFDYERVKTLVDGLLKPYPPRADTFSVIRLLAHTITWSREADLLVWLSDFKHSTDRDEALGYGEVLVLRHLARQSDMAVKAAVDELVAGRSNENARQLTGAAYSAANLWAEPAYRDRATEILCALVATDSKDTARAIIDLFRVQRTEMSTDECTRQLLAALHNTNVARFGISMTFVIEVLAELVRQMPQEVSDLCFDIVRTGKESMSDMRAGWVLDVAPITSVALALQRLGDPWRTKGIELFEELLSCNVYGVDDVIRSIDGVSTGGSAPRPRRLRRRVRSVRDNEAKLAS
jgi:hypothetical protein